MATLNPMNPGSDNNPGSASAQFNESAAIQLRKKIIMATLNPMNAGSDFLCRSG
jgi:hypothetical protein